MSDGATTRDAKSNAKTSGKTTSNGKKSVLLVDDDPFFRSLVRPVLDRQGLHVFEASSGAEAFDLVDGNAVDLLIVDGDLPDTDGIQWIRKLREKDNQTAVIFVSAFWRDVKSFETLTQELKVSLIIHKPVMTETFGEQVAAQLCQRSAPPPTTEEHRLLREAFSALSRQYVADLTVRLQELDESLTAAKANPTAVALTAEARTRAHKIRGTAGSHGLPHVGELIGRIEDILIDGHGTSNTDTWIEIDRLMGDARAFLEKTPSSSARSKSIQQQDTKQQQKQQQRQQLLSDISNVAIARVLVVDDDESFLDIIEQLGKRKLVEVVRAVNSREALEHCNRQKFDGAIIDVQLGPDEVSFDLARELRKTPGNEILPLAFASASGHVYNRVAAAQAGASLYLSKPLDPDAFESAVNHLLALSRTGRQRVLVVDDDAASCNRVTALLQCHGMEAYSLNDPVRILEVLHELTPDLLMLDVMMPCISGYDVCRMVRTMARWQDLPIIFLTGETGLTTRIAAFKAGADDYLPKPYADEELISRVKVRVERSLLIKERAEKDTTTGLWLRRPFMEQVNAMMSTAKRVNLLLMLALIDLDHFKQINDTHGHLAGDAVLSGFGKLFQRSFRVSDLRGRWGGDEFIGAFQGKSKQEIHGVLEKFVREFNSINFPSENGGSFNATLSIGLAAFPEDGQSTYELIGAADRRVYLAKKSGRNAVVSEDKPGEVVARH